MFNANKEKVPQYGKKGEYRRMGCGKEKARVREMRKNIYEALWITRHKVCSIDGRGGPALLCSVCMYLI